MNTGVKLTLYVVLSLLLLISGYFFFAGFKQAMTRNEAKNSTLEEVEPAPVSTEMAVTNLVETNAPVSTAKVSNIVETNLPFALTNAAAVTVSSNSKASQPVIVQTNMEPKVPNALGGTESPGVEKKKSSSMGLWTGLFLLSVIGLGIMIALDLSNFFGNRALKVIYNDDLEGIKDPEYEQAEEVWTNGNHLEAIRLMREYLNKNPREQHVALRIAEIYEKDLNNYLAAALEYEEVLKKKLPAERWGWAAIHLCNLYFKINQEQKAFALLRRIEKEYPNTAAAEKARKRLSDIEAENPGSLPPAEEDSSTSSSAPEEPKSNLPPGFRKKK
ncbi:MAG: tetratricopeptide repeat protein [Verrucomicrobiota bacterium]|nr:tetratricopeptide repeat protein [Verrucomicrobiota bacterium]